LFKYSLITLNEESNEVEEDFALKHFLESAFHSGRAGLRGVRRRVVAAIIGRGGAWSAASASQPASALDDEEVCDERLRQAVGLVMLKMREMAFFTLSYR